MEASTGIPEPTALAQTLRRNIVRSLADSDFPSAEAALAQLKAVAPLWVDTRGLELEILIKSGHLDEAKALAPQLVALFPSSARIQYLAGLYNYKAKRYPAARQHFEESDRLHPYWGTTRYLAKALSQMAPTRGEAEAILLPLSRQHPECWLDLAWVYEQTDDVDRAVEAVERYLEAHPESDFAKRRLQSLKAKRLDPKDMQAEVETLLELDEPVSNELLASYFEALLKTGQMQTAREFFSKQAHQLDARGATGIGWIAYQLKAYDLAVDWFLVGLDSNRDDVKFFSALEKATELAAKGETVLRAYRERISTDKRFYGHAQRLQKRLEHSGASD